MITKDKQAKLIRELANIIEELEWVIAIPDNDEVCQGLIIGTPEYVTELVEILSPEPTDIVAPNTESGDVIPDVDPSEDKNYH